MLIFWHTLYFVSSQFIFRVMAIPATVGYFFMYDNMRFYLRQRWGDTLWAPVTAGASTRGCFIKQNKCE